MKAVWKFPLRLSGGEQLCRVMPEGAVPVRFAMQGDVPTLWCLCDRSQTVSSASALCDSLHREQHRQQPEAGSEQASHTSVEVASQRHTPVCERPHAVYIGTRASGDMRDPPTRNGAAPQYHRCLA